MKTRFFIISFIISLNLFAIANTNRSDFLQNSIAYSIVNIEDNNKDGKIRKYFKLGKTIYKNPFNRAKQNSLLKEKITSIVIIVLTGPLGGHRLYLGTAAIVPIFYALTLGGGFGILPLIDLIYIVSTKDIEKLKDNDKIFMWIGN